MREYDYDMGFTTELMIWLGLWSSTNMQVYGTPKPPIIEFGHLSIPVKMYHGEGDREVTAEVCILQN